MAVKKYLLLCNVCGMSHLRHLHKLVNSGRSYQSNMFNGILEAISGKQYDSPSYELIATHRSSKGEVSQTYDMAVDCLSTLP